VDPQTLLLTGLTRDGIYLVEDGEVTGAVNNFRFNESPVAMLGRLAEVGATVPALPREWGDYFTRCAMPPVGSRASTCPRLARPANRARLPLRAWPIVVVLI
jgi:Predicted Zn-dependent proteases and their inactivated homologs